MDWARLSRAGSRRGQAVSVMKGYYPLERFPQSTLYALEDLLPKDRVVDQERTAQSKVDELV